MWNLVSSKQLEWMHSGTATRSGTLIFRLKNIITHAIIDKSVREIDDEAFVNCPRLLDVEGHDGVERVGRFTFRHCPMLRRVNLPCVRFIEEEALMIARS